MCYLLAPLVITTTTNFSQLGVLIIKMSFLLSFAILLFYIIVLMAAAKFFGHRLIPVLLGNHSGMRQRH